MRQMRPLGVPGGGRSRRTRSRAGWIAGALVIGLAAIVLVALAVVYPKVGAYEIRKRLSDGLAARLGREIHVGAIRVRLGHATVTDLSVRGPLDGDTPLVHVDRIDLDFDAWASLIGRIELGEAKVDGVIATLRRGSDGKDNVRDVLERWHSGGSGDEPTGGHTPRTPPR